MYVPYIYHIVYVYLRVCIYGKYVYKVYLYTHIYKYL